MGLTPLSSRKFSAVIPIASLPYSALSFGFENRQPIVVLNTSGSFLMCSSHGNPNSDLPTTYGALDIDSTPPTT